MVRVARVRQGMQEEREITGDHRGGTSDAGTQPVLGVTEGNALQVGGAASGASGGVYLVDDGVMAEATRPDPPLSVPSKAEPSVKASECSSVETYWGRLVRC